jgi:hypothetical protein
LAAPQVVPEQQSVVVAQAPPTAEQPQVCVPPLHRPPQQSFGRVQAPVVMQPQVCIELQTTPPQQSAVRVQAAPAEAQPHCEVVELHAPLQHWASAVHPWPSFEQHVPRGQTSPVQQSLSIVHRTPAAPQPQSCVAKLHTPLQQLAPPPPPQDWPSGWHVPQVYDMPS